VLLRAPFRPTDRRGALWERWIGYLGILTSALDVDAAIAAGVLVPPSSSDVAMPQWELPLTRGASGSSRQPAGVGSTVTAAVPEATAGPGGGPVFWAHWVAYEIDLGAALIELQQQVFASGRYYARGMGFGPQFSPEPGLGADARSDSVTWTPGRMPATIQELFEGNDGDSTYSILDMAGIADTPALMEAAPLSQRELLDHFGTTKPDQDTVERNLDALRKVRPHGFGTYVVAYEADQPVQVLFLGTTGD
jgi:hypothetical protein